MPPTSTKYRHKGTKERGPFTPKPVQGRVIARHLIGQSNRRIAREERIDRETVGRILTRREVVEMIAQYQQRLLSLVPKAIEVLCDALSSGDERTRVAVATKLVEVLQVMPRGGSGQIAEMADQASSSPPEEVHGHYAVLAQVMAMMMEKSDALGVPLPELLVQLRAAAEAAATASAAGSQAALNTPASCLPSSAPAQTPAPPPDGSSPPPSLLAEPLRTVPPCTCLRYHTENTTPMSSETPSEPKREPACP